MKSWRINLVLGFFLLAGLIITIRLAQLQILKAQTYRALANGQQESFESPQQTRGEIFLSLNSQDPIRIAANKDWWTCYVSPKEIKDTATTAQALSKMLKLSEPELKTKLRDAKGSFVVIKEKLSEGEIASVKKQNITGVYLQKERYRFYPYQDLASDVIGFVDQEAKGKYGTEKYFDECLSGNSEWLKKQISPYGYSLEEKSTQQKGCDIYLTLDKNVQMQAEGLLAQAQTDYKIEGGEIIVIDPNTGKIIAMAEVPSFNPNNYGSYKLEDFTNGNVQHLFEPGSMFKGITMASGLNEKVVTPETTFEDKGFVMVGGRKLSNFHGGVFGVSNMTRVLEKSINTGAVFVESRIGGKTFLKYLEKFGIFDKTGIELPGEIASKNSNLRSGREVNFATAAFGQGLELTPINFVRAFSVLANGGKLIQPYIVDSISEAGTVVKTEPKILKENIISKEALDQLSKMLEQVTETGYGKKAKVPGYYVAGKTGTSQIPYASLGIDKTGYSDKTWQSFIGFYPAFEPKFLMLIKLDNPNTATAEYSAAPMFGKLAHYILNYYKIPPDYDINSQPATTSNP